MIQKEILHNQQKIKEIAFIKRELDFAEIEAVLKLNKILVLIGSRRAGKTFLTFQILRELLDKKEIKLENICYIDFSSLLDKNILLESIKDDYISLFPDLKPIFVFDEIQELENFPSQLISLLNSGYKIIVTGSNAHLLSRELSTILRGKVYAKEVSPLDFKEYLKFKDISLEKNDLILDKPKYKNYFLDFLKWGGFPEIVLTENIVTKENILKNYLDVMIYKDLRDRYSIKNDFALNFFIKKVLSSHSKELNINKIFNDLKSQGTKIGKDTLYDFFVYLNDIYLVSSLTNFWTKIKGTKKVYLVDVAFSNFVGNFDYGKRFENFVYLELKKKYQELYFLSENYEIDFFIPKENTYIQAVYELNFENLEREVKYLSKQNGKKVLIYFEKEENLKIPENIKLVSFDELLKDEVI